MIRNPSVNSGDSSSIPGSERSPGGANGNPLQYSWLRKFQGQGSPVGYSPCDRKELDITEHTHTLTGCLGTLRLVPS